MEAKIKATGEIVDVVPNGMMSIRTAAYKTPDGRKIPSTALEYPKAIDWEQRRYEIAKDVTEVLINMDFGSADLYKFHSTLAIKYADELIKQLKGEIK